MPRTNKYPYRADLHVKLIQTAIEGKTISYTEVGGGRFMIGRYLYRILREEKAAWRPPLTAVVVGKRDGRPAKGFREAMDEIAYLREGETEEQVWRRALRDVHEYWRPKELDELVG